MKPNTFLAGAAAREFTPLEPLQLAGYPHFERISTGVHDPLLASALCLDDGQTPVLIVGCDIIFISKPLGLRVRNQISAATGIPITQIVVTATHTHSGPRATNSLKQQSDPSQSPASEKFLERMEQAIVAAAVAAWEARVPAEAGLVVPEVPAIGSNRHDPSGPRDARVPVLAVRATDDRRMLALMLSTSIHPTVLHEDSTVVSGDFPGLARRYLQQYVAGEGTPIVYHTGAAGNQSPRHVTRGNTLEETARLGEILGKAVESALAAVEYTAALPVHAHYMEIPLPKREVPTVAVAEEELQTARARLDHLRQSGAPRTEVRTAECDWFGAENGLALAKAAEKGMLQKAYESFLPAGLHVIGLGRWTFVFWPGEVFVEFALEICAARPDTFVITYANGEMQGYVTTREAVEKAYYEAGGSMLANPAAGEAMVQATLDLLARLPAR